MQITRRSQCAETRPCLLQIRSLKVVYEQDGSDIKLDNFAVSVRRYQQPPTYFRSHPHDVTVAVRPINDEPPRLTLATPIEAWSGDVTPLNRKSLTAEDADSGPEALWFIVTHGPTNGHLAKVDRHSKPISNFTQLDVNNGLVVFVHGGKSFISYHRICRQCPN